MELAVASTQHISGSASANATLLRQASYWRLCPHSATLGRSSTRPARVTTERSPGQSGKTAGNSGAEPELLRHLASPSPPASASLPILTFCFLPHCGKNNFLFKCLNLYVTLHPFFGTLLDEFWRWSRMKSQEIHNHISVQLWPDESVPLLSRVLRILPGKMLPSKHPRQFLCPLLLTDSAKSESCRQAEQPAGHCLLLPCMLAARGSETATQWPDHPNTTGAPRISKTFELRTWDRDAESCPSATHLSQLHNSGRCGPVMLRRRQFRR